jgi:hypothetical protein
LANAARCCALRTAFRKALFEVTLRLALVASFRFFMMLAILEDFRIQPWRLMDNFSRSISVL